MNGFGTNLYIDAMSDCIKNIKINISQNDRQCAFINFYHFLCDFFAFYENSKIPIEKVGSKQEISRIESLKLYYECIKHYNSIYKVQETNVFCFGKPYPYNYPYCYRTKSLIFGEMDIDVFNTKERKDIVKAKKDKNLYDQSLKGLDVVEILESVLKVCKEFQIINYYNALELMYVDEIKPIEECIFVRSDFIDDEIWNFILIKDAKIFEKIFKANKDKFVDRKPRFYLLDPSEDVLKSAKASYQLKCEDSWFISNVEDLKLNFKSELILKISDSPSKEDVIETIMQGFSTGDSEDPYGNLSPTYRTCLENKLEVRSKEFQVRHFVAYSQDKPVSIATVIFGKEIAYLNNVTTLKEFKRHGISKQVLSEVIKFLRKNNISRICFATETGAYTETYYKNLGFTIAAYGYCFEEKEKSWKI